MAIFGYEITMRLERLQRMKRIRGLNCARYVGQKVVQEYLPKLIKSGGYPGTKAPRRGGTRLYDSGKLASSFYVVEGAGSYVTIETKHPGARLQDRGGTVHAIKGRNLRIPNPKYWSNTERWAITSATRAKGKRGNEPPFFWVPQVTIEASHYLTPIHPLLKAYIKDRVAEYARFAEAYGYR